MWINHTISYFNLYISIIFVGKEIAIFYKTSIIYHLFGTLLYYYALRYQLKTRFFDIKTK